MLNFFAFPIAVILGFLAGLGVGGGSLLMLWLTLSAGMDYTDARIINLLFFLPSALIATVFHQKQGSVDLRKIAFAILWGSVAAAAGSIAGKIIDTDLLKKAFGILLLFTGLRELFYRPRKAK